MSEQYVNTNSHLSTAFVHITEGDYEVRTLHEANDLILAYRLRYTFFSEQLKWVPHAETGLETDLYDRFAVHVGVFDKNRSLLAYVRLTTFPNQFMLEKEFRCILSSNFVIRKERDTSELTRFCVATEARGDIFVAEHQFMNATALLFKGVYQLCLDNNIRFSYGVTDRTIHRYLTMKGYPYSLIGIPRKMPDGVVARAVILDWREFETINSKKRPELLSWYRQRSINFIPKATATV